MWNDGTLFYYIEYAGQPYGNCLYANFKYTDSVGYGNTVCSGGSARRVICQRPSGICWSQYCNYESLKAQSPIRNYFTRIYYTGPAKVNACIGSKMYTKMFQFN